MKTPVRLLLIISVVTVLAFDLGLPGNKAQGQASTAVTEADLLRWTTELSNRGRWGANDGLGAANLITPTKRRQAAGLVKFGITVSMAHDVNQAPAGGAYVQRTVLGFAPTFISDQYQYFGTYHGSLHSHVDALGCHVHFEGVGWNDFWTEITQESGCPTEKGGILALKNGIFTRGILFDMPRFKGKPWLEAGEGVTREDLEAYERWAGLRVSSGDVIFLYTGRWRRQAERGPYTGGNPGWHASIIPFLKERDVALIGNDHINDVTPIGFPAPSRFILPVHQIVMPFLGINIFDNLDLEEVAQVAGQLRRWEFLLTAAPLRIERGMGSPANPLATF